MSATEARGEADGAGFARGDRARRGAARRGGRASAALFATGRSRACAADDDATDARRVVAIDAGNARGRGRGASRGTPRVGRASRRVARPGSRLAGARLGRGPGGRGRATTARATWCGVGKRAPGADIIRYAPTTRRASAPPVASRRGSTPRGAARRTPRGSFVGSRPRAARSARRSGGTRPGPERGNPPRWRCHGARDKEKTRESIPTGGA